MVQDATQDREDALTDSRLRADYTDAEREASCILQARLLEVLQGKRDRLELLTKYPKDPRRLGVIAMPAHIPHDQLRLPVMERLLSDALEFVRADAAGGPVSQTVEPDGKILEQQRFSTKYPHVLIERRDLYVADDPEPLETSWSLYRVQNQRRQVQINRFLDAANLAFDVFRSVR